MMTWLNIVLFVHLLTVAGAFCAIGVMTASMTRLRASRDLREASAALGNAARVGRMMPIVTLLLLVTGGIMTQSSYLWTTAWIDVGIAGLLLITAIGGGVIGSRERALHGKLSALRSDASPVEIAALVGDPVIPLTTGLNVGLTTGVMFVMVVKGSLVGSLAALIAWGLLGLAMAALIARPRTAGEGVEIVAPAPEAVTELRS